ncbi:MAG: cytochrome c [Nitrospina sp.]|jgi:hypothetical protein|nr:cytochrome c [Nitrospina sp.]
MIKTVVVLTVFFIVTGFTYSKNKESNHFPEPLPTSEGQLIYQEMGCPMCHGYQGMGDGFLAEGLTPKPRNFTSYEEMTRVPYQSMYFAIKDGIPYSGMPSFNLTDSQIDDVISYVRSFLTDNYITLSTCSNVTKVVSLENVETEGKFEVEIDRSELVSANFKAGEITLTPNFSALRKAFYEKKTKLVRVHVNLTKKNKDKKDYLAIIALRMSDCIK